jgi:membrane fusion protein, multidrug efflux system
MERRFMVCWAGAAGMVTLLLLEGCGGGETAGTAAPAVAPVNVQLIHPHRGGITRSITLPGTVAAWQQATLYAKVGGYLKTIAVDKGDEVKAGDLLADIEVPELLADLAKARAEVEVSEIDYRRVKEAQKKAPELVVPQTVDDALGKLKVARAGLERDETLLGFTKITAPFAGVITRRFVDPGAFVPAATSGSAAQNAAIVTLADFSVVRVYVAVPEPEVPSIRKDTPVQVGFQELPGKTWSAGVTRFAYALDETTRTMTAEIDLPNPQREMRPGMYAIIKIGVERHADALLFPAEAVLVEKAGRSVFVVGADGKAHKKPIKAGFEDGVSVEILDGVTADQPVVLLGKLALQDGQAVNATEAK